MVVLMRVSGRRSVRHEPAVAPWGRLQVLMWYRILLCSIMYQRHTYCLNFRALKQRVTLDFQVESIHMERDAPSVGGVVIHTTPPGSLTPLQWKLCMLTRVNSGHWYTVRFHLLNSAWSRYHGVLCWQNNDKNAGFNAALFRTALTFWHDSLLHWERDSNNRRQCGLSSLTPPGVYSCCSRFGRSNDGWPWQNFACNTFEFIQIVCLSIKIQSLQNVLMQWVTVFTMQMYHPQKSNLVLVLSCKMRKLALACGPSVKILRGSQVTNI